MPHPVAVRPAVPADAGAMATLSASDRRGRAEVEPGFWRRAEGADELHRMWIEYLVGDAVTLVATDGSEVVGWLWAASLPDRLQVDDWTVAGERWPDAGQALIEALPAHAGGTGPTTVIGERHLPAKAGCLRDAGFTPVAAYRVRRLDGPAEPSPGTRLATGDADADAIVGLLAATAAPPHGFPAIGPDTPGGLTVVATDADDGILGAAVGSPSGPAPPVYDPGGTTCVVDRVVGERRETVLAGLEHHARARGDVQLLVIVDTDDTELIELVDQRRYRHPVDLWSQ